MKRRNGHRRLLGSAVWLLALLLVACAQAPSSASPAQQATVTRAAATLATPATPSGDNTPRSTTTGAATARTAASVATPSPAPTSTAVPPRPTPGPRREEFSVDFGDFTSTARIYLPAGDGPFSTILIIAGSGPDHVDEPSYSRLVTALTGQGYAAVRYTKHYVYAPPHLGYVRDYLADASAYMRQVPTTQLLADAERVYRAIAGRSSVDPQRIIIYGQSEGGTIAAQLALAHPESAGVILHGSPARTSADEARDFYLDYALPFLRDVVDLDHDGALNLAELLAAQKSWADSSLFPILNQLAIRMNLTATPSISPAYDVDRDGQLGIETELHPAFEEFLAHYDEAFPGHGPTIGLPAVSATLPGYRRPILVQQGGHDGYVDPADAELIEAALAANDHPDHTLIAYPLLGHALGPAASRYLDPIAEPAPRPLEDLLGWLDQRYRIGSH